MSKSSSIVDLKDYVDTLSKHIKEYVNTLVDNQRAFVNQKCDDERIYVDTRFTGVDENVRLAYQALEIRLEHLNGLYQTISKMGDNYPTISDLKNLSSRYDLQVSKYDEDIRYLRESRAELSGKANAQDVNVVRETVARNQMLVMIGLSISVVSLSCGALGTLIGLVGLIEKFI